ncbi:MAG: glycerophosphodiester phosphodiesterase [Bacteroidales bacterium]|nr:glycerophosphodiester phosphodiesterase [Bacteroidales bacterium]
MNHYLRISALAAMLLVAAACSPSKKLSYSPKGFPVIDQGGKVAIVAHRGFWNCEQAGFSENSIASLKAAQDAGLWGSECDVHVTADDIIMVNHDPTIKGKAISTHKYADFAEDLLPNGEKRPTFDEYLVQAAKCKTTILVIELKKQPSQEREDKLLDLTVKALKAHDLFDPTRVLFITFSKYMCERVAKELPQFINQFLSSDPILNEDPAIYAALKINGVDYHRKMFIAHPEWVKNAHDIGMSVNVWTVNKAEEISRMIEIGVDAITTNEPLLVREILGSNEFKKK